MRNAYALLGLSFIIVFGGAYMLLTNKAEAPVSERDTAEDVTEHTSMTMQLTSPAFQNNELIPSEYTCDGDNISPPLTIAEVPEGTASLVIVMDDPDIPEEVKGRMGIEKFNHWAVYNLPPDTTSLAAGELSGIPAENSRGEAAYTGPCPPTEYEPTTHRYIFRLYALSGNLNFITTPTLDELETAAKENTVATATLIGLYSRVTESD